MTVRAFAAIMGMPISVNVIDATADGSDVEAVFDYLKRIDMVFSPYKKDSETGRINRGELSEREYSREMRAVIEWCERTKAETHGYFDARYLGHFDPSGLVKGYAIHRSSELLRARGFHDFFIEAGGDIQTSGHNVTGMKWRAGIRDPYDASKLVNVAHLSGEGIATSGNYERGRHIYDPVGKRLADNLASVTVIAGSVFDADRYATAAFAMGTSGLQFIGSVPGLEGQVVAERGRVLWTPGFLRYMEP